VPTKVAVEAIRSCHQSWLDSGAKTKGDNTAWCLWFRKKGKTEMSSDYETKWAEHQLSGEANTDAVTSSQTATAGGDAGFVGGSIATSGNGDGGIKAVSRDGPSDGFESCGSFARRGENHDSVRNVTVDAIQCPTFFSVRPEVTPRNRYIKVEEKMTYQFKMQHSHTEMPDRSKKYLEKRETNGRTGAQEDRRMERAGRCLAHRSFRLACVVMIFLWKSHRPLWLFVQNKPCDVEAAIKAATAATQTGDVRRAVKSLTSLKGVGLKMASAILTAMFPERYTVCDFRASHALGQKDNNSLRYYVAYLDYFQMTAAEFGVTLRDFDRANWFWSWEQTRRCEAGRVVSLGARNRVNTRTPWRQRSPRHLTGYRIVRHLRRTFPSDRLHTDCIIAPPTYRKVVWRGSEV